MKAKNIKTVEELNKYCKDLCGASNCFRLPTENEQILFPDIIAVTNFSVIMDSMTINNAITTNGISRTIGFCNFQTAVDFIFEVLYYKATGGVSSGNIKH